MAGHTSTHNGRRQLLLGLTGGMGAFGVVSAAVPFVQSWNPSAKARAAGSPVAVDVSKLEPGQRLIVEWRGRPVWVINRPQAVLETLKKNIAALQDPQSEEEMQPAYAQNDYRSIKPQLLVLIGLCTHLGCSPTYRPESNAPDLGADWDGGFFCPCHGSKFDLAGRVYKGVPAPTNLPVPPYRFIDDQVVLIGEDQEEPA